MCYKVGGQSQLRIFADSRIPTIEGFKTPTIEQPANQINLVKDLINPYSLTWNSAMINSLFSTAVTNEI